MPFGEQDLHPYYLATTTLGDINMDGILNVVDLIELVQHLLHGTPLSPAARVAAEAIEESGKGLGTFKKDPGAGDRKEGEYYILKDGRIGKYKGKNKKGEDDFAAPGDDDF